MKENSQSVGLQSELRDAGVFVVWYWIVLLPHWLNTKQM